MKSSELTLAKPSTKIYLDLDGVLADFFHEYAKLAGVPENQFGRHDYRSIPPAKTDPTLDKMIGTDFFHRLPKFSSSDDLVNLVLNYVDEYNICSSPLRNDNENSEHWKREWIKDNLNTQPSDIIITGTKEKYAVNKDGSPNILIDDRRQVLDRWIAKGGIGIKFQADEDSLAVVAKGLKTAYGY